MSRPDAWLAEATMYRVLRRTLPAQRHDVLSALSALKLQLALARRRAQQADATDAPPDDGQRPDRLAQLEAMAEQQLAAQTALAELRLWDGLSAQRRGLDEVIAQCLDWVRPAAALRGHRIGPLVCPPDDSLAPGDDPAVGLPWVDVPAAHYLVLALAFAVIDTLRRHPTGLQPQLHADARGWRLGFQPGAAAADVQPPAPAPAPAPALGAADGAAPPPPPGQALPQIDSTMLQALAAHCSQADARWTVGIDRASPAHAVLPVLPVLQLVLFDGGDGGR